MDENRLDVEEEDTSHINHSYITDYIRSVLPAHGGLFREMEEYAHGEAHVPIVQPEVAHFLEVLCGIIKPRSILEVGTAIGYSAGLMYFASGTKPKITTIERYDKMIRIAKENFMTMGMARNVELIEGDAVEEITKLTGPYDLIFLDAAKGQYPHFLQQSLRLLQRDGVLICDNVLYRGMTAEKSLVNRRKITIVKRLRSFVDEIMGCEALETSLLPLGDGVTISRKK